MRRSLLAGCALSLVVTCAPAVRWSAMEGSSAGSESPVLLAITNDHWSDVDVFLLRGPDRRRLGTLHGGSSEQYVLSDRLFAAGSEVLVRLEPKDLSGAWTSEPFTASAGRTIHFRVAPDVSASMRVW